MSSKHSNDLRSILDRIKTIVPGINEAVEVVQTGYDTEKRLLRLKVLRHSALIDLGERINQAIIDSEDATMAQGTLVSDQLVALRELERLADQIAGARTVIQNLDVWIQSDVETLYHILEIMDLNRLTEAAGKLPPTRLIDLIAALQDAAR